jgi:branched-chain amino acid transport system substrate-binding protein
MSGLILAAAISCAQAAEKITIGVLSDLSGPVSDAAGPGSVIAARMAIDDAGGSAGGFDIGLMQADHQLKPDIAVQIASRWYTDENVDLIVDVPVSPIALAVQEVARKAGKMVIVSGAGSTDFTGKFCSETGMMWVFDSYGLVRGTTRTLVRSGKDTWFLLAQDNAFGTAVQRDLTVLLGQAGGKMAGTVRHPWGATDLSSFLLQAQASAAKVIALASGPPDNINAIKTAREFQITESGQQLVALLFFLSDVKAIGLQTAQGLVFLTGFYWDQDDETRAWAQRFYAIQGKMPTEIQAGVYSSVRHYLKAVSLVKTRDAKIVAAKMRELPVNDFFAHGGTLRKDGRLVYDQYLMQVKAPSESTGPWDLYKIVTRVPAADAFRPLNQSDCPLVKN